MKTQIVYVLTFDESNYYYEQLLISAYSVRFHNPNVKILVVTDEQSKQFLSGWREELYKYITEVRAFKLPEALNNMQRSRWLKTKLRNLIDGDYLFIDTDTIICRSLTDIDNVDSEISAVANRNCYFMHPESAEYAKQMFRRASISMPEDIYFNSGVIFVRDNEKTRRFYESWHNNWQEISKKGVFIDQISLHKVNQEYGHFIKELSGEWNCQIYGQFLNYLHIAYIIHYYSIARDMNNAMYTFKEENVYKEIRNSGVITKRIVDMIANPYSQFTVHYQILYNRQLEKYNATQFVQKFCYYPKRIKILKLFCRILSIGLPSTIR